jgi:ABC-type multidrug transport system fused ATPase/permease subunit
MGVRVIEKTLFRYIWKHSRRDQIILLFVTSALFPFLFLTLELPKRIINDAIGANTQTVIFGVGLSQIAFLSLLCAGFLMAVLAHGLLKMRINTMKGILAERLLRRLRFGLVEQMLRFPKPYFQNTSQGEVVTIITSETEPMGGLMGDALAQPVLQAGQMLTILTFLFLQSVWFGLAAIALIPLQAWLIPRLQRQINLLNKARIREVRDLAGIIGESAAGASDLRLHGGLRHRLALVTERLGVLFGLRFKIYQKKFFMKFLNNFITQLTPFFFFLVGGILVIQGAVSLGALVAALAAYKDLSAPWKELLTYYNQVQDMSLRWETVMDRFAPEHGFDASLTTPRAPAPGDFDGSLVLEGVTVTDVDGMPVLQNITAAFSPGSTIAITAPQERDRSALVDLMTREVMPSSGRVLFGGHPMEKLPQATLAARLGHVNSRPMMFRGAFRDNMLMPLMTHPLDTAAPDAQEELQRVGNSVDPFQAHWLDVSSAHFSSETDLCVWWLDLLDATGASDVFFRQAIDLTLRTDAAEAFGDALVALRPTVWRAVAHADLARHVLRFDADRYNPALTVDENLLFAVARHQDGPGAVGADAPLVRIVTELGLAPQLLEVSRDIVSLLHQTFGTDGTSHPLFRKLGLDAAAFERALALLSARKDSDLSRLSTAQKSDLISLSAQITAEQLGAAFPEEMRRKVVALRAAHAARLQPVLADLYSPIAPDKPVPGLTVLENALFGRIADAAGARGEDIRQIVLQVVTEAGMRPQVMDLIFDLPLTLGGANLPAVFAESLALARAAVKRPDVMVLDMPLASFSPDARDGLPEVLRKLLPGCTLIFVADRFATPDAFDTHLEIRQGRLISTEDPLVLEPAGATSELAQKLRTLESTDLFAGLKRRQLRLLAFGAKWYHAEAGEVVFNQNDDPTDGTYMILEGNAELFEPARDGKDEHLVATVGPGTLVGELGLILNEPRALSMRAKTDLKTLRIGAEEFLSVVEHDASVAFKLLQVVAGYKR